MLVLIDNQKSVEIPDITGLDEEGQVHVLIGLDTTVSILTAWSELDPSRRNFRFGDDHTDLGRVIVAWVTADGTLVMDESDPLWSGSFEHDGYSLVDFATMFPDGMLQWGAAIGEPEVTP